ncbi:MAG TPA: hypothetical protein ENL15_03205, partial [Firmicutes bacterium]|nr:hypothetical protein [Bacillota bacterium]
MIITTGHMNFNYLKRLWLLFLLLFTAVNFLSAGPLFFSRSETMYTFSRGLPDYRLEGIPLELIYAGASPVIFNNILFHAISGEEGVDFFFPSGSRLVDNSLIGVEAENSYENYFFFLNKKRT